jgi:integrase
MKRQALSSLTEGAELSRFWFWTANCKLKTAVSDWQARLLGLAEDAKVPKLHAHRFRDAFAVELLLAGVPIERVSILLGHTSIKVTEKHYSPWIRERQEQAEADVRRTWSRDPVALMQSKGDLAGTNDTQAIHERLGRAN